MRYHTGGPIETFGPEPVAAGLLGTPKRQYRQTDGTLKLVLQLI
jgi:hypothetical protein